ncbi:Crp/Fnr family transcriptional regulator [Raineyella sp. LH-20]|uniref:Crp/Fnr family transcriptional regulator n=1 Tax=Raineyella sp. LH-20 TaxID=3081204 RepID=UPI0029545FE4|nr:Crp/Fnr family transcriptional regulator [Raineyella sp. LH-20]WOP19081.1 Crp/Fnr family transcriptional regulator [Raineyella sp. LH-20]
MASAGGKVDPDVLKQAPLFRGLDREATNALVHSMSSIRLSRGAVLFHEGDSGNQLYIVVSGKLKLGRTGATGRENLMEVLGPGQMFGELSVFDPGPRSTTATAVTAAELRCLEHDDLVKWLKDYPQVAQSIMAQLARRLRHANDSVSDLVFSDVPGRVAKALVDLSGRFGEQRAEGILVHHDLTQEELAQLVGASRETVNKALADFAARGWIRLEPRSVTILDMDRVSRRAR